MATRRDAGHLAGQRREVTLTFDHKLFGTPIVAVVDIELIRGHDAIEARGVMVKPAGPGFVKQISLHEARDLRDALFELLPDGEELGP